jgi:hypothetical protein
MWVGSNVDMLPQPPPIATDKPSATTSTFPLLAGETSLWDLMQLSPATSLSLNNKHGGGRGGVPDGFDTINSFMTTSPLAGKSMKLPPMPPLRDSCMLDLNYALQLPTVDNNNKSNKDNMAVPPLRPLKLPPMLPLKTAPAAAPLKAEFPRAPHASPASVAEEMGGENAGNHQQQHRQHHEHELAEIANEFSPAERQDMAAFLSDVDLDSEDERDSAYKNEEELGRILHDKKSSKNVSSV